MDRVRWGIMGAGGIAHRFARALEQVEGAQLVAVSGRSIERLDAFAGEFPVDEARRYASAADDGASAHTRLAEDPDVDAVYLALPHGMHEQWATRLLQAGKAVLCEKPAVLSEREALHVAEVCRETGTLFMEAMKPRFTPARNQVKALIEGRELGAVTSIDVAHRVDYGDQTGRYLLDPVQGGTLYDLGCYGIAWAEDVLSGEAEVERCRARWMPASDGGLVDIADDVRLRIGGVPVHLDFAGDAGEFAATCRIVCACGEIEVPLLHRPVSYIVRRDGRKEERIDAPAVVDDFYGEVAHFCDLVRSGAGESPVMPLASTVRNARIIDAIRASWARGVPHGGDGEHGDRPVGGVERIGDATAGSDGEDGR